MPGEAPRLLAPILAEFCSLHPGIELECDTRMTGLEVLREDVDLSIVFHRGHQEDSAFITRELATLPSIVVAAPSLLARTGMPRHVRELKSLPCITTLSALKGQPWQFQDAAGEIVKVPVRSRYRVNSGELAVAGARQGIGFAIVAAYPCQEDLATGRLQEVSLDLRPAPLQLLGAYSHRHSVTARVRALLELIQCGWLDRLALPWAPDLGGSLGSKWCTGLKVESFGAQAVAWNDSQCPLLACRCQRKGCSRPTADL
jgi:DNA-binding transcriptional LysR family regulator